MSRFRTAGGFIVNVYFWSFTFGSIHPGWVVPVPPAEKTTSLVELQFHILAIHMKVTLRLLLLLLFRHSAKSLNAQKGRLATSHKLVTRLHLPHEIVVRLHVR